MVGEEKRHQMMQNLFGDQSEEEEEEEEEVESEHESNRQPDYASDDGDGGLEPEGEGEADVEGEGEVEVEGQGEAEMESEGEMQDVDPGQGESEGERDQSSQEIEVGDQRVESEGRDSESDEKEEYGQRVVTSRRREVIDSESERSEENRFGDNEDEEVNQARSPSKSPGEEKDEAHISSAPEIRDVFGDSEDEEEADYVVQDQIDEEQNISPMEEETSYGKVRPEDIIPEDDGGYESEEEQVESKTKEKPVGPPLELEIPLRPPPAYSDKMNMIKVSNIMGIDPKPFDPATYVEEDVFVTDESGSKKRISLVNNIVRWRKVKKPDGTTTVESNARFVEWSDGSVQLMIGNEVLDISVQDAQHDQAHLFLRHGKGILQSQGRILRKMRFMPSSLTSNSHRLLTALVDSRHKKVYKVKNCFTDIDPEREKEQKEKAESQTIRANVILNRKKEKVSRKYMPAVRRERQLSPGFLEDALEEEEDTDYYDSRRSAARRRFEEDLEMEAQAEKRIINAKKKDIPRQTSLSASKHSRRPIDFEDSEKEESEYETEEEEEEEERSPPRRRDVQEEQEYEEEEERDQGEEEEAYEESEEEAEEPKQSARESAPSKRKGIESDEESPPRKTTTHRRMAIVYDSEED
ncbi:protein LEO1 homolog [Nicotiana tabacum]|uniref:Protein LEO1 homolog n=1 Tax=Nicotiana tabacum TaxID=4097 RepID=A0A1S3XH00_TOBAC|nr:protein LEO1 homolog isoform X1 [Nicotiana tomentosiformis]XP_016439240.1 PREDICTED: protein LEO1 homolog isoform X1 [Nicotiana tabacum]XP_033515083.1 protein LEO1 homolog isoform X1 [Nicotiana tomentosiformis]